MKTFDKVCIHITNHCNLNCARCCHYAPLAEPWYISEEEFRENLIIIRDKIINTKYWNLDKFTLNILGGEPLLHPNIENLLQIARTILPNANIQITTNGIKLLELDKINSLINTINDNNIILSLTIYKNTKTFKNLELINFIKHNVKAYNISYNLGFFPLLLILKKKKIIQKSTIISV